MSAPDVISAKLGELLAANWNDIVSDANANKGITRIGYSIALKKTADGTFAFDVSQSFKVRQEVSAPKVVTVKGVA